MRNVTEPVGLLAVTETDLVRQVARRLTDAILAGRLGAGQKVAEAAVARELGISRAPVREAARLLESEGLLEASPRRGFFVRRLSADEVDDLYDLRLCLERHAAVEASRRLTAADRAALRDQLDRLHEAARSGDPGQAVEADYRFHRLICQIAGNGRVIRLFDGLASEMRILIGLIGRLYDDPSVIAATHEPILAAIEAGHPERIVAHIDHHLGDARREVGRLVRSLSPDRPEPP